MHGNQRLPHRIDKSLAGGIMPPRYKRRPQPPTRGEVMLRIHHAEIELADAAQLEIAREVLRVESKALATVADRLGESLPKVVGMLAECSGNVLVTGMGKAGVIAQKIAATLSSTGTRAFFLHPAEAAHGDLGRVSGLDV